MKTTKVDRERKKNLIAKDSSKNLNWIVPNILKHNKNNEYDEPIIHKELWRLKTKKKNGYKFVDKCIKYTTYIYIRTNMLWTKTVSTILTTFISW